MTADRADESHRRALEIMTAFVDRTGVTSDVPPERYLWTDAFAVCNLLALGRVELAERVVAQVHDVLGRHRADDGRAGWLSGLPDDEARGHPTRGGLRIGKRLPARQPDEQFDERLEWERDGQYFHYLTKWMHALDQLARYTGEARYNVWARELASVAHRAFTYFDPISGGGRRMYWKMSVDLAQPLVTAMGHHDPLDGYVTCLQLQATAVRLGADGDGPSLVEATADFAAMIPRELATSDPLGIGGLLTDGARLVQLRRQRARSDDGLVDRLVAAAEAGVIDYEEASEARLPADHRLAFRELGLAIGLTASMLLGPAAGGLARYRGLGDYVVAFWLDEGNQRAPTWQEHRNINEVMLVTALAPDGFLALRA